METYHGYVRTPTDAVILFEACRLGSLPRVQRRLSEKERQSIKSGSVFVWDEREAGMRRWTDGKSWSASRVSGSFLTYREMEGKRGGNSNTTSNYTSNLSRPGRTPESNKGSDSDAEGGEGGEDGYRYKPDGLMKQSFSITTSTNNHLHLISYYSRQAGSSLQPSQDPALRHIRPPKGMYPEASLNDPTSIPPMTRTPMTTQPMPHGHSVPYGRPNGQIHFGPPSIGYAPYSPSAIQIPQQQYHQQQPMPYPQPMGQAPHPALVAAFQHQQSRPPPPTSETTVRLPQTNGHHKAGPPGNPYPPQLSRPHQPQQPNGQSDPSLLNRVDPRLTASSPLAHGQILPSITNRDIPQPHLRTPSPNPRHPETLPPTGTSSQALQPSTSGITNSGTTTIPSIGALVNGAREFEARSRSGSHSPSAFPPTLQSVGVGAGTGANGSVNTIANAPRDIPPSKVRFAGEDIRALKILDRAFRT